jgi:hypothetical protein
VRNGIPRFITGEDDHTRIVSASDQGLAIGRHSRR